MKKLRFWNFVGIAVVALLSLTTIACPSGTTETDPSMALVIKLSGVAASSASTVSVTYGPSGTSSSNVGTCTATGNVSGGQASLTIYKKYADDWDYIAIKGVSVKNSGGTLLTVSTSDNTWFKFEEDGTITMNYTVASEQDSVTVDDISVVLDENFVRGFDASYVDFFEEKYNVSWYDTDGTEKDFFKILASHGVNTVRLRIWNDPSQFSSNVNGGMNDLTRTVSMAKRVKAAGLDLMLDFHYSDTFADPGRQIVPAAWKNLKSADAVAEALSTYTTEVLTALRDQAGITPKFVQVGNEINPGMMIHESGKSSTDNTATGSFAYAGNSSSPATNLVKYLSAGADAVHKFDSSIKVVIHLASSGRDLSWFFNRITSVNYDVIGLSYYPWESSHGTIATLKSNLSTLKTTFSKEVMVVECSAHWNDEGSKSAQNYTYQHMIDPDTGSVYSDLETDSSGSTTYVKGSVQNQANVIRHIIEETADSGGTGVFAWGGDLYGNYKWGMFNGSGKALASMDVFGIGSSDDTLSSEGTKTFELNYSDSDAKNVVQVFSSDDIASFADSITKLVITVTDVSESVTWITAYACDCSTSWTPKWENIQNNSPVTLTSSSDSDFISGLKEHGLKIQSDSSFSVSVVVTYSTE